MPECHCEQCRLFSNFKQRCDCCVYLLHGKRSETNSNQGWEVKIRSPKVENERKNLYSILSVIDRLGNKIKYVSISNQLKENDQKVWSYIKDIGTVIQN